MSEYSSPRAQSKAEQAQAIKDAAEARAQARHERNSERVGRWKDRFAKLKEAGSNAWNATRDKAAGVRDAAREKAAQVGSYVQEKATQVGGYVQEKAVQAGSAIAEGAKETGRAVVDNVPFVDAVDSLQARARAGIKEAQATMVEKYNVATNKVAELGDKIDRLQESFREKVKAKAAELALDGLRAMVQGVKALQEELNNMIAQVEAGDDVPEGAPETLVNKLSSSAAEHRKKADDAKNKASAVGGLRGWLRRREN